MCQFEKHSGLAIVGAILAAFAAGLAMTHFMRMFRQPIQVPLQLSHPPVSTPPLEEPSEAVLDVSVLQSSDNKIGQLCLPYGLICREYSPRDLRLVLVYFV